MTLSQKSALEKRDGHVRRRLRALQIRQWGRRSHVARHLYKLGIGKGAAFREVYKGRRGTWALSGLITVHRAMRNLYFTDRGLISIVEKWLSRHKPSSAQIQLSLEFG